MKLILEAIKSMFRSVRRKVDSAQATANTALSVADSAQATADVKMNADNPVGTGSFSMNRMENTTIGMFSHAEGDSTIASGDYSHAEGAVTIASGKNSHAEGNSASASGNTAHAEGSQTTASGDYSHAEGNNTIALGTFSHAEGSSTEASGTSQHVQGKFNIINSKYAHIVGNGTNYSKRSNAHTLDWDGRGWFAGGLKVGGTSQDDAEAKEVATKDDKLPNPNALTFTGAVEGTYDGSAPMEIEIPEGGAEIGVATETTLGGVKASAKTEGMTQPVGISADGFLFTAPGAGGGSDWELLTHIKLEEESAISKIGYDFAYKKLYAILQIPQVENFISTGDSFAFLHGYGLYYQTIGDKSYSYRCDLLVEKIANVLKETFRNGPENGVGTFSAWQTRNSILTTDKEFGVASVVRFEVGGTLVLPAGTILKVFGVK